jgi:hypothetical protein
LHQYSTGVVYYLALDKQQQLVEIVDCHFLT